MAIQLILVPLGGWNGGPQTAVWGVVVVQSLLPALLVAQGITLRRSTRSIWRAGRMSHPEQLVFFETVKQHLGRYFNGSDVLEGGSLDINGGIRRLFADCRYIGVSLASGSGVDLVAEGQLVDLPTASVDAAVSAECFEHNPYWRETLAQMARVSRPGGLVAWSCAYLGRPDHGTVHSEPSSSPPTLQRGWTYYHNLSRRDAARAINLAGWFQLHGFWLNCWHRNLYLVGIRSGASSDAAFAAVASELAVAQRNSWRTRWRLDFAVRAIGDRGVLELDQRRRPPRDTERQPVPASSE